MQATRVNEIDLLRFFAAMAVVLFHYSFRGYTADSMTVLPYPLLAPCSKYGYLGVQLFFIISGFVILMTASNGSLRSFIVSRLVRLYPAFWAACTITFVLILLIGGPRYSATLGEYLANMTMLSGFFGVPFIDGVYWSLLVELRFYALVIAVLMMGRIHQAQPILLIWLIASVILVIQPIYKLNGILIVNYSAYFIAGATCFLIWSQGMSKTKAGMLMLSWGLAVFQTVADLPIFENHYHTPINTCAVVGIISAFFIVMVMVALRRTGMIGRSRWLLAGSLTYPLYLLHENIGFMLFNIAYPAINSHVIFWGTLLVVLGIAYAVHILIEKKYAAPFKLQINKSLDALGRIITRLSLQVKR